MNIFRYSVESLQQLLKYVVINIDINPINHSLVDKTIAIAKNKTNKISLVPY